MYLLGGSANHLDTIWNDNVERDMLESWQPSPGGITIETYRSYLNKTEYQQAWVSFFADQLAAPGHDRDWRHVVVDFLVDAGQQRDAKSPPMLDCLTSGLGHPLIHLGYAFEVDSQQLAAEALGLLATCYDASLATVLAKTTPKSQDPTSDLFELFSRVHDDAMLPTFRHPGDQNLASISRQLRPHRHNPLPPQLVESLQSHSFIPPAPPPRCPPSHLYLASSQQPRLRLFYRPPPDNLLRPPRDPT